MVRVTGAADSRVPLGVAERAGAAVDLGAALVRVREGDAEAFRVLYRDIQPRLLRYLRALAGPDAEDLASETWLQVTRDLPGFTGSYDGFRGWVATIARHRALDHLRARTRRPPALAVPAEDLAAWPAADDTAARALDAATAGQVLGKRPGAIRTAAHRGLKTLHRKLEAYPATSSASRSTRST